MAAIIILCAILGILFYVFSSVKYKFHLKVNDSQKKYKALPEISKIRIIFHALTKGLNAPSTLKWIGSFNKLVSFTVGPERCLFVNDHKIAKEILRNPIFNGKPQSDAAVFMAQGEYGILSTGGIKWKEQRRFALTQLRHFGFGTKNIEPLIHHEVEQLLATWAKFQGAPFSPNNSFYFPTLNSFWKILTGNRASSCCGEMEENPLVDLLPRVYNGFKAEGEFLSGILVFASNVSYSTMKRITDWVPIFDGLKGFHKSLLELRSYFQTIIDSKRKNNDVNGSPTDMMSAYLKEIAMTTDVTSEFFGPTGEMNLLAVMVDLFLAVGDTSGNMLAWAMLHLIRNPSVQEKIWVEIHAVIGKERLPRLTDRPQCPYTEAFLWEVLRTSPTINVTFPHRVTENTNIGPYFVHEHTRVSLNIYHINHDPKIWGDPQNFRPQRFLSPDGNSVLKNEAMAAFGYGQRKCLGEQSARDNMFLFVSAICQRFRLEMDPRLEKAPPLPDTYSTVHTPAYFNIVAIDRYRHN